MCYKQILGYTVTDVMDLFCYHHERFCGVSDPVASLILRKIQHVAPACAESNWDSGPIMHNLT